MTALCTYCSSSKRCDPGVIPAIRRYKSERIERVHAAASSMKLPFLILSGRFGLIQPERYIPLYDHLLKPEEVPALIELVLGQIPSLGIDGFVYFTKPLASRIDPRPYHDTIVGVCRRMSLPFLTVELED